jgi:hypothetical protein
VSAVTHKRCRRTAKFPSNRDDCPFLAVFSDSFEHSSAPAFSIVRSLLVQCAPDTGCAPDKPGHSPDALCIPGLCAPKAQGMLSSPLRSFPRFPFVSHIFSIAGSNTGAEREVSQGRTSRARVAVGAKRRASTGLPRSVHSPAKNGRSPVPVQSFPHGAFFCPPAAAAPADQAGSPTAAGRPMKPDPQPNSSQKDRRKYRVFRCK